MAPETKSENKSEIASKDSRVTQITNDISTLNILAYMLGGSILLMAAGSIYYNLIRAKQHKICVKGDQNVSNNYLG